MENKENKDSHNIMSHILYPEESLLPMLDSAPTFGTENKEIEEADNEEEYNNEVYISCELCDYKSGVKKEIKTHMEEFHKNLCYFCDYCDFTTLGKNGLRVHMKSVHKGFQCDICNYKAGRKIDLKYHVIGVHSDQRFYCTQCDKSYGMHEKCLAYT